MKNIIAFLNASLCILLVSCSNKPSMEINNGIFTTIENVVSDPSRYNHKRIVVSGYLFSTPHLAMDVHVYMLEIPPGDSLAV